MTGFQIFWLLLGSHAAAGAGGAYLWYRFGPRVKAAENALRTDVKNLPKP